MPATTFKGIMNQVVEKAGLTDLKDTIVQNTKNVLKPVTEGKDVKKNKEQSDEKEVQSQTFKDIVRPAGATAKDDLIWIRSQSTAFTLEGFATACHYSDTEVAKKILNALISYGALKRISGTWSFTKTPQFNSIRLASMDPWVGGLLQGEISRLTMLHRASLLSKTVKSPLED